MVFPFSFTVLAPGLFNPFSAAQTAPMTNTRGLTVSGDRLARRPSKASLATPTTGLPKKRGWVPSSVEVSQAVTMPTSTTGFLDTPSKYREMAASQEFIREQERDEMEADLPSAKRRRGLAGSIISTAFSAALIGTAVGLTVYRLWRDRSKDTPVPNAPSQAPPPYEEEWAKTAQIQVLGPDAKQALTPRRKVRPSPAPTRRPTRHRRTHVKSRSSPNLHEPYTSITSSPRPQRASESDIAMNSADELDVQMSSIGDKLYKLIEDGRKALGAEIVVMSESKDDEVDDGEGDWEEVDGQRLTPTSSRTLDQPPSYPVAPMYPGSHSAPVQFPNQTPNSQHARPPFLNTPDAFASPMPSPPLSLKESASEWQSPELRESMQRAREAYLQKRMQRS